MKLLNPSVKIHHKLYIDRYFDAITLEKIKETLSPNENQEPPKETSSKMAKMQIYNSTTKELLTKGENKLRLRLMCDTKFDLPVDPNSNSKLSFSKAISFRNMMCCSDRQHRKDKSMNGDEIKEYNEFEAVILHFHGGGFVAQSSGSHQIYTRE